MMNSFNNSADILIDFEDLPAEAIALEPQHIYQAVQLSSQLANEGKQWQAYLQALALFGFEQWLHERVAELTVNQEQCSVLQPHYANVIDAVCNLRVGKFKLCLLVTGTLTDEAVALPKAVFDLPEYVAHFYVLIEVQEEQEQVTVRGFRRYDELLYLRQSFNLQAAQDWTYELPLAWFDSNSDCLLLYLRCLEPTAIPLPSIPSNRLVALSDIQAELAVKLRQLKSPDRQMWQILSWEQAVAVLTSSDLLDWLYQVQTEKPAEIKDFATLSNQLSAELQSWSKRVVNVGLWLRDELDEFAQSLAWVMLPTPAFEPATVSLRSPTDELEDMIVGISTSIEIPPHARGAYRDLQLAEVPLRLYALTWPLQSQENIPEWTLLLVLGAQPDKDLPCGIKMQVSECPECTLPYGKGKALREQTGVLVEQVLEENTDDIYLYTRVVGTWDESFLVTIALRNGEALTLPPFAFIPA